MKKRLQLLILAGILLGAGLRWLGPDSLDPSDPAPSGPDAAEHPEAVPATSRVESARVPPPVYPAPPSSEPPRQNPAPAMGYSAPEWTEETFTPPPPPPEGRGNDAAGRTPLPAAHNTPPPPPLLGGLRRAPVSAAPAAPAASAETFRPQTEPPNAEVSPSRDLHQEMRREAANPEPNPIPPPPEVEQITAERAPGILDVAFQIRLPEDMTHIPNALILSQRIPEGWQLAAADPQAETWQERERVVKWLFMGDAVREQLVTTRLERIAEDGADAEVEAWFNYRLADGSFVEGRPQIETRVELP